MKNLKLVIGLLAVIAVSSFAGPAEITLNWQEKHPVAGGDLGVTVEVTNVLDLDTYSFEIVFDTAALSLTDAEIDAPLMNIKNILRTDTRPLLPVIKSQGGKVVIAATLAGSKPNTATPQSGVVGVAMFKVLADPAGKVSLRNVRLLDSKGNAIETAVTVK